MKKTALLIFSFYILCSFHLFSEKTENKIAPNKIENTNTAENEDKPKNTDNKDKANKNLTKPEKEKKTEKPENKKSSSKKITINSAQYTEYKKIPSAPYSEEDLQMQKNDEKTKKEKPTDELIIFTGLVSISVSDANSTSTIKADKIIHNKTRETLTATGNVFFERKVGSSQGESFTGKYLIFNITKLEGIFLDGIIEQAPTKKGKDPFRIHTEVAGKNESGVISFKNGLLTTSKEDDPLWSIRASRIWLLPGGEMAFANGFLSVGVVPLFYIPFFYYPSDEMIVHPVFGYKNREGAFVQTTTYLYGRKPAPKTSDETSFSNFMQSDTLKKQKLEGLFFKKLEESETESLGSHLKLITDIYSGLGFIVGIDGVFTPKNSYIKKINFLSCFGFSNTLYPMQFAGEQQLRYSVYDNLGNINKNHSNFFGFKGPFRYNLNFGMNISKSPFSVLMEFPFVSDPYFKQDFLDSRTEDMNWFKYFLDKDKLAKFEGVKKSGNPIWKINGSIRPSFPKLRPWINSISIDRISANLNFQSRENKDLQGLEKQYAPERDFFHPRNFSPEIKLSMDGNIFSTSMLTKKNKQPKKVDLGGIKNPFTDNFTKETKDSKTNKKKEPEISEANHFAFSFIPLYKAKPTETYSWSNFIDYSLGYRFDILTVEDLTFDYKKWNKPQDIEWKEIYSDFYKINGDINLNSKFSFNKDFLNITNSFNFKGNYQDHKKIKDNTEKEKLTLNNYKSNIYSLTNTNSVKVSPFIFTEMFKPTYTEWQISEKLIQNKFTGSYRHPKWETQKSKWDKDYITAHSLSAGFGAVFLDFTQLIKSTANLPPLLQAYSFNGSFSFPYTKLELSSKIFEKEKAQKKWFWSPFKAGLNFTFPYNIILNQSYIYNIEDKENENYNLSFGWKSISTSFNAGREIPQKLKINQGWVPIVSEKKFIPKSLAINISNSAFPVEIYSWKNRIKLNFSFSSTVDFNLIRITDSYFIFRTSLSFKIHEFWDISFSSLSRNDSIARYFQDSLDLPLEIPGEKNVLKDLAYSFYFWDEQARRRSGFKLKSLKFSVTHYLKDWKMKLDYSVKPEKKTKGVRQYYSLVPEITFVVQWQPIGDIKVQTKTKDKKFSIDRGKIK